LEVLSIMRIAILGATGVLGRQVVPRLVERGHAVVAVARDEAKAARLRRLDVETVIGDILDAASLPPALQGCDAALHLATAVPRPGMPRDFSLNDRIRREGTANLIAACRAAGVERYVQQSIAHLVAAGTAELLDEDAPLHPTPATASAAEMEAFVRQSGLRWTILRGGAFYGPGTGRDEQWRAMARDGQLAFPGDGAGYTSLIHVTDMADATVLAAEQTPAGATLAIVDDLPVTYVELFRYIAAVEGGPEPQPAGPPPPVWPAFRVSNARARAALGWWPRLSSYRSGFA
jgi:nucleoside-diphosphate-sugar epimerase